MLKFIYTRASKKRNAYIKPTEAIHIYLHKSFALRFTLTLVHRLENFYMIITYPKAGNTIINNTLNSYLLLPLYTVKIDSLYRSVLCLFLLFNSSGPL